MRDDDSVYSKCSHRRSLTALLREERYQRHFLREDARQSAIALGAVAAGYAVAARNDFVIVGHDRTLLILSLASRLVFVLITAIAIALLLRCRRPCDHDRIFWLMCAGITIIIAGGHLTRIPSGRVQGTLFASVGLIVLLFLALRGPLRGRSLLCAGISATSIVSALLPSASIDPTARFALVIVILVVNIIGFTSARRFDDQRRERFEAERRAHHVRQQLIARMRELAAEKERAEAMAKARAAFLAAMSHEFRTPMNAVIGLSDLLVETPMGPDHRAHARTIRESARALLGMLEDILDFAKIDAQKLTLSHAPFDLARLAASVGDMLRPGAAARGLTLVVDVAPELPSALVGDDARLRQVLVNLVANAVKFTERGAVTLRVASRPLEGDEHEITVRVEDTGVGMTPEVLARIFLPFEQGDTGRTRRWGGTGLGLTISKQIVAAMGGDLLAESAHGRGSVFSFALRLTASARVKAQSDPSLALITSRPLLAILVVDDHLINREVARALLARLGYAADLACDGPEAIAAALRRDYDVILMDLHMPGMSGIEAAAHLFEAIGVSRDSVSTGGSIAARAPLVVAMTASVLEEDREACRSAGMSGFLGKPIDIMELGALLRIIAEERGVASPPAPREPLSSTALSQLHQIERLGAPRFVESLCRIFVTETRRRLGRIRDAIARGDMQEVAREAHSLRSASATLGANELSAICAGVESAARDGRVEGLGARVESIAAHVSEVERALAREVPGELP